MLNSIFTRTKALRAAILGCLTLCLLLLPLAVFAAVGAITSVSGQVSILRGGQLPAVTATVGTEVNVGDFVRTKSASGCEIRFSDGNVIKVGPRSRIDISEYAVDRDTRTIGLKRGKVEAVVVPPPVRDSKLQPKRFEIHTPNAVAGVRGTDLLVFYEGSTTGVLVISLHGGDNVYAYSLRNPEQTLDLPAGFITYIRDNQLPTPGRQATEAEVNALVRELTARIGIDPETLLAGLEGGLTAVPVSDTFPSLLQPAYEVGRVDLTGNTLGVNGYYSYTVNMTAKFLSPTAGGAPDIWGASNIVGTWTGAGTVPFDPTSTPVFLSGNGVNGEYADATFTVNTWNPASGQWSANIANGFGGTNNDSGNIPFIFSGSASGQGAVNSMTGGSFSGTAGGSAQPDPGAAN